MACKVLAGPASREIAEGLSRILGLELVDVELRVFPDGESKVRLLGDLGDVSIVVQSTYPPVDSHLFQALLMAHKAKSLGSRVVMVMPYLGYARQDKEFLKGEAVSIATVARLLKCVGVERLLTVDIHSVHGLGYMPFQAYSVSAIPLLAERFKGMELNDPLVVSPDLGGRNRAEAFAKLIKSESVYLRKFRDRETGEIRMERPEVDLKGRDAILVDDIVSTGGSLIKAAELLKEAGADRVYSACTHALLVGDALERIKEALDGLVATNTVPSPVSEVDVSPVLAGHLKTLV